MSESCVWYGDKQIPGQDHHVSPGSVLAGEHIKLTTPQRHNQAQHATMHIVLAKRHPVQRLHPVHDQAAAKLDDAWDSKKLPPSTLAFSPGSLALRSMKLAMVRHSLSLYKARRSNTHACSCSFSQCTQKPPQERLGNLCRTWGQGWHPRWCARGQSCRQYPLCSSLACGKQVCPDVCSGYSWT